MTELTVSEEARLAEEARRGLRMVEAGEEKTMEGWLVYGAALNDGRKRYATGGQGDKDFGAWVVAHQLDGPDDMNRLAAMWAAGNPEQFQETHKAHPRVRTVRGNLLLTPSRTTA